MASCSIRVQAHQHHFHRDSFLPLSCRIHLKSKLQGRNTLGNSYIKRTLSSLILIYDSVSDSAVIIAEQTDQVHLLREAAR